MRSDESCMQGVVPLIATQNRRIAASSTSCAWSVELRSETVSTASPSFRFCQRYIQSVCCPSASSSRPPPEAAATWTRCGLSGRRTGRWSAGRCTSGTRKEYCFVNCKRGTSWKSDVPSLGISGSYIRRFCFEESGAPLKAEPLNVPSRNTEERW
jgi:hypothetical protein